MLGEEPGRRHDHQRAGSQEPFLKPAQATGHRAVAHQLVVNIEAFIDQRRGQPQPRPAALRDGKHVEVARIDQVGLFQYMPGCDGTGAGRIDQRKPLEIGVVFGPAQIDILEISLGLFSAKRHETGDLHARLLKGKGPAAHGCVEWVVTEECDMGPLSHRASFARPR